MAEQSSVVAEQSSVVAEQSSVVAEQSSVVAEQSSVVAEQSSVVAEQSSVVAEQSSAPGSNSGVNVWAKKSLDIFKTTQYFLRSTFLFLIFFTACFCQCVYVNLIHVLFNVLLFLSKIHNM